MQLVKQIQMKPSILLDQITSISKDLFNIATFTVRQQFFKDQTWLRYNALYTYTFKRYQKL